MHLLKFRHLKINEFSFVQIFGALLPQNFLFIFVLKSIM